MSAVLLPPPALWSLVPGLEPPLGVQPNFINPEGRGYVILVVGSVLLTLMIIFYTVRMYTKLFLIRKLTWDDLTCSIAVVLATAFFAVQVFGVTGGPLGRHQWDVTLADLLGDRFLLSQSFLVPVLVGPALLFAKSSFFLLYFQLFRPMLWMRICIYVGSALLVAFHVGVTITMAILTTPSSGETWVDHIFSQNELNAQSEVAVPFAAVGFVFDVYLLVLPLRAVWKLQLPNRRKIGVTLIFMTGLLACISSMLSVYYRTVGISTSDTTWSTVDVDITTLVEMYVGVIVSCMPSLSKMLQHHLPNHLPTYQSLSSKFSTRWSSLRATVTPKGRHSSGKKDPSVHEPSAEPYGDIEAYPGHRGTALETPQYELGQLKSVKPHIEAGRNQSTGVVQSANDDQIHLIREIWQR